MYHKNIKCYKKIEWYNRQMHSGATFTAIMCYIVRQRGVFISMCMRNINLFVLNIILVLILPVSLWSFLKWLHLAEVIFKACVSTTKCRCNLVKMYFRHITAFSKAVFIMSHPVYMINYPLSLFFFRFIICSFLLHD